MPYMMPQEAREEWDIFCYYEDTFTPEECARIIEFGKGLPPNEGVIEGSKKEGWRQVRISWINWNQESNWIFERLSNQAINANLRYKFNLNGFLEPLQFTQYERIDDHYDWHQDIGKGLNSIRKLSAVVQLSNENTYEGGDLEFFMGGKKDNRKQGTAYFFPSFEIHRVTPLTGGERYSLVAWISGPPFA